MRLREDHLRVGVGCTDLRESSQRRADTEQAECLQSATAGERPYRLRFDPLAAPNSVGEGSRKKLYNTALLRSCVGLPRLILLKLTSRHSAATPSSPSSAMAFPPPPTRAAMSSA